MAIPIAWVIHLMQPGMLWRGKRHKDSAAAATKSADAAAAFARAGLLVLARAILHARLLAAHNGEGENTVELWELLDAVHNIPTAIENPHSHFGIYGAGHAELRRQLEDHESRWGHRSARVRLTALFDTSRQT